MRRLIFLGLLLAVALNPWGKAWGQTDPNLFVCSGCTSPPSPADPNFIDPTGFNVGSADSSKTFVAPLLLLVVAPVGNGDPTLSLPTGVTVSAASTYYGLNLATDRKS